MSLTAITRKVKLNTGATMSVIATGSFSLPTGAEDKTAKETDVKVPFVDQDHVTSWLLQALKNGYRHIDTAFLYFTEPAVGRAVREFGIPREELFVTTKLPGHHFGKVRESLEMSLQKLGLDYVDLYLMHLPQSLAFEGDEVFRPTNADGSVHIVESPTFNDAYAEMEKLLETGKVKAIGVSNFSIKPLEELAKTAKVTPAANQIELHPYLQERKLREYCASKGITVAAYTPSGYSVVRNDPVIQESVKKYTVTPNQITLAWRIANGTVIVPKSENDQRQRENITLPTLDAEDITRINDLDRGRDWRVNLSRMGRCGVGHMSVWGGEPH